MTLMRAPVCVVDNTKIEGKTDLSTVRRTNVLVVHIPIFVIYKNI